MSKINFIEALNLSEFLVQTFLKFIYLLGLIMHHVEYDDMFFVSSINLLVNNVHA